MYECESERASRQASARQRSARAHPPAATPAQMRVLPRALRMRRAAQGAAEIWMDGSCYLSLYIILIYIVVIITAQMRALRTIINALLKALPVVAQAFLIMMLCGYSLLFYYS